MPGLAVRPRAGRIATGLALAVALAPMVGLGAAPVAAPPREPTTASPGWFPSDSLVRALLVSRIEAGQAVGLVVGLLEPDGGTRIITAGKSGGPGERPLDGHTVFEIGSVTKVFTCTLLADMARRGEVRFDQPVAELLPKSVKVPAKGDTLITLVELASQHSGLPRLPDNLAPRDPANPYADYTVDRLYAFLSRYTLPRAPGAAYEYSNLGMGLLGHALAYKARRPYEDLVTERVLEPLGMHDTRITLGADMQARLAAGHDGSGATVANWGFSVLAGCGALRSTADDLLHFLAANLDSVETPISADLRETHRPRHTITKSQLSIGLAWHMLHQPHADIVMHNGGTGGYRSFIGYDPALRVGVVVLSNMAADMDDLALHLLNPALPLKLVAKHSEVKLAPGRLDGLVGTYALAPTFVLTVTREGDALFVQATGQGKLPIYAESDTAFFYRAVDAQLSFERDPTGKGIKLTLHQNGREMPGMRVE